MNRFAYPLGGVLVMSCPAILTHLTHASFSAGLEIIIFGAALLASGFLLARITSADENLIPGGPILAIAIFIAMFPQYAVDMYYAFQAGKYPELSYMSYAIANMTGANRLLVGLVWPAIGIIHWFRTRERVIFLRDENFTEIVFISIASLYPFFILIKSRIGMWDFLAVTALFSLYVWKSYRHPLREINENIHEEIDLESVLGNLSSPARQICAVILVLITVAIICISAKPFAEAIIGLGAVMRVNEFLPVQWMAPLVSELPVILIALLFVLSGCASGGLAAVVSAKINQWTLLIGMLPLAMSIGASEIVSLSLDKTQMAEFFLATTQTFFAASILASLQFTLNAALLLLLSVLLQFLVASLYKGTDTFYIPLLAALAWIHLAAATVNIVRNFKNLARVFSVVLIPKT